MTMPLITKETRLARAFTCAVCVLASSLGIAQPTHADDEVVQIPATEMISKLTQDLTSPGHGIYWEMAYGVPPASFIEYKLRDVETKQKLIADSIFCKGFEDPNCTPRPNASIFTTSVLGKCSDDDEIACIESVREAAGSTELRDLKFSSYLGVETEFAQSPALQLPRGSSISEWKADDGTRYLVIANIDSSLFNPSGSDWTRTYSSFTASIVRPKSGITVTAPRQTIAWSPMSDPYKIAVNPGANPPMVEFKPETRFELTLRLPNTITGWFNARIADGTVKSRDIGKNRTLYTFTGNAAATYLAGGAVPASSLEPGFMKKWYGWEPTTGGAFGDTPGDGQKQLDRYNAWLPHIGDKALATQGKWVIKGVDWTQDKCFTGGNGMNGLLATNAAVYNGTPPTWDSSTQTLSFKVASPHVDEKGNQTVGTYTLAIPAAAVSCLYGKDKLPAYAEISVTSGTDGTDYTSVITLGEKEGWVSFSAKGFHYSQPTIAVKFRDTAKTATIVDLTPTSTPSIPMSSGLVGLRTSISGRKLQATFVRTSITTKFLVRLKSSKGNGLSPKCTYAAARVTCTSTSLSAGLWTLTISPTSNLATAMTTTRKITVK